MTCSTRSTTTAARTSDDGQRSAACRSWSRISTTRQRPGRALDHLDEQNAELGGDDVHSKAYHMRDNVIPAMPEVRAACDRLERMVPDDLWPLPRYREMLFIR
jgi:glutamine synthetase